MSKALIVGANNIMGQDQPVFRQHLRCLDPRMVDVIDPESVLPMGV